MPIPIEQIVKGYTIAYDNLARKWTTRENDSKYVTLMYHMTYQKARQYVEEKIK